jgi:enoyl-CoA hydratase
VVVGGEGKAFCAGADVASMVDMTPQEAFDFVRTGQKVMAKLQGLPQPSIAAVTGAALGGGCELALACDMRIASGKAKFGLPEVGLGIMPGFGGTQRLPRLVGRAKALELILSGGLIGAEQALAIGLVNRVVAPDDVWTEVNGLCAQILAKGPGAIRRAKYAVDKGWEVDLETGCMLEASQFGLCFGPEQREGMTAFLEKRLPKF